jgi:hypothetical protein
MMRFALLNPSYALLRATRSDGRPESDWQDNESADLSQSAASADLNRVVPMIDQDRIIWWD